MWGDCKANEGAIATESMTQEKFGVIFIYYVIISLSMKQLRFAEPLPKLVLGSQKDTTWRINDDKEISTGDQLSLCYNDKREFAKAEVIWIKETTFENLTNEDKEGHEKFSSDEEMLQTYSGYYHMKVEPKTKVKIIKFRLL